MYQTFYPRSIFRNEIDGLLASLFEPRRSGALPQRTRHCAIFPMLNVTEANEGFELEAELPGVSLEDLDVSVIGRKLTISGERPATTRENYRVHRREISTGKFTRTITFPCDLEADAVKASFKNGVLTLELPKAATAKPKKIQVTIQ